MAEPVGVFIDYDTVRGNVDAADIRVHGTRYRIRPKDSGCSHAHCDYPTHIKRDGGAVDVVCFDCGLSWLVVPEPRAARKERG